MAFYWNTCEDFTEQGGQDVADQSEFHNWNSSVTAAYGLDCRDITQPDDYGSELGSWGGSRV